MYRSLKCQMLHAENFKLVEQTNHTPGGLRRSGVFVKTVFFVTTLHTYIIRFWVGCYHLKKNTRYKIYL